MSRPNVFCDGPDGVPENEVTGARRPEIVGVMSTTTTALKPAGLALLGAAAVVAFLVAAAGAFAVAFAASAAFAALFDGARI
jgi:hypothetical protein